MKKLFLAVSKIDVMFVADEKEDIKHKAQHFISIEAKNKHESPLSVIEITDAKDIPESWRCALLWGIDDEITPESFLCEKDVEYAEYMRLKAKFEGQ